MKNLSGANQVVLITGSTRGIGLATAVEFLKHGDRVIVFCRRAEHQAGFSGF